ncbi:MAG: LysR family transcriptional regulator [Betaproteobacteria bacterium]|jgi:DNA-binding transcriptional LysR family regulator
MRLSLDALQVLDSIARNGSFARAASELHRVPSALTYTIQQLESDLNLTLFNREGRRAVLTAAGHELLNEGRILLKAAADLECRIQQVAKGWETELRIAVDTITPIRALFDLIAEFEKEQSGTRIRLSSEVLGGTWDALVSGRADFIVGAPAEAPSGGGYAMLPMARLEWVFAVTPSHPIMQEAQPLAESVITRYRAVSVADTSRDMPPRTVGLLSGQDVLTVASMADKLDAQVAGLGVGFLPAILAAPAIASGHLVTMEVQFPRAAGARCVAWRPNRTGRALRWFIQQFEKPEVADRVANAR